MIEVGNTVSYKGKSYFVCNIVDRGGDDGKYAFLQSVIPPYNVIQNVRLSKLKSYE